MKIGITCCTAAMLAVVGCGRSASTHLSDSSPDAPRSPAAPTRLMSAPYTTVVSSDEAVMRLTNARCDREVACNHVGSDAVFIDRDACARQLGRDAYANLEPRVCPGGIDEGKLATCLADVRNERCNNTLDAIERLLSCRRRELCL